VSIIVQKFGGTSVSSKESRMHCLTHIKRELNNNNQVVVVVSAMGRKGEPYATDTLLSLLENENLLPNRETDLLLSTGELISANIFSNLLWQEGIANTVLTGGQAGIITDSNYGNAKIQSLNPQPILDVFKSQNVVVVTGFQGIDEHGEITTLGRGGSDTSGTALGASLNAERVDIFTDVKGIYSADPRIVEEAVLMKNVSYAEVCNLAHLGAKVIHPRAVEIAMQKNIPIRVRSTFLEDEGTLISNFTEINNPNDIKERNITGITQVENISQIKVLPKENEMYLKSDVFQVMYENNISIDFININSVGASFTVPHVVTAKAKKLLEAKGYEPQVTENCSKISVVGAGITGVPGVMYKIYQALELKGIPVLQCADSHTTIWVLVPGKHTENAVRALHNSF
jgi:aspartate kinase